MRRGNVFVRARAKASDSERAGRCLENVHRLLVRVCARVRALAALAPARPAAALCHQRHARPSSALGLFRKQAAYLCRAAHTQCAQHVRDVPSTRSQRAQHSRSVRSTLSQCVQHTVAVRQARLKGARRASEANLLLCLGRVRRDKERRLQRLLGRAAARRARDHARRHERLRAAP